MQKESTPPKQTVIGTSTWTPITSDQTDSYGRYSATWIPPATGYFTIKAEWEGNSTHIGSNNSATINSITFNGEYVFSVEFNSTINVLFFNSTDDSWCLILYYAHNTHRIVVDLDVSTIPEFPSCLIRPLFVSATLAVIICRKKLKQ